MGDPNNAALTLDAVHPDDLPGPIFALLAAAPLYPLSTGLYLCTLTLQFTLSEADAQPQVTMVLETGSGGIVLSGGSQEGTQGGLRYAKGSPVVMTGVEKGVVVANESQAQAAAGIYSLTVSGIARAPLQQTSAISVLIADDTASMAGLIMTMAVTELASGP